MPREKKHPLLSISVVESMYPGLVARLREHAPYKLDRDRQCVVLPDNGKWTAKALAEFPLPVQVHFQHGDRTCVVTYCGFRWLVRLTDQDSVYVFRTRML